MRVERYRGNMFRKPIYRQFRRASVFSAIVLAGYLAVFLLILLDLWNGATPRIGFDFSIFYTALIDAKLHGTGVLFDFDHFNEGHEGIAGQINAQKIGVPSPVFYMLIWPFTKLPFGLALIAFMIANLLAWGAAIRLAWPQLDWRGFLLPFASGYMFFSLAFGQAGGFLAFLLIGAFYFRYRGLHRWAGFCGAGLLIQPQFLPMIPVLFVLSHNKRALWSFLISLTVIFGLSMAIFGMEGWISYVHSWQDYVGFIDESKRYRFMGSAFAFFTALDAPLWLSLLGHSVIVALGVLIFKCLWATGLASHQFVGFILAAYMIAPWPAHFDMVALVLPAIVLMRLLPLEQRINWRFAIVFYWLAPFFAASLYTETGLAIYPLAVLLLFAASSVVICRKSKDVV